MRKLTRKKRKITKKSIKKAKKGRRRMNCWDLFETAITSGAERVMLWGPKGMAKSRAAIDILAKTHNTVSQCTLNEDIAVQELLGHYIPKGDKFEWHDGPVMNAYRSGHGLVVNEMGRASGAVQDMFLGVMDDHSVSMIALANGENVRPGSKFQVIATSNSAPDSMDEALVDRFDAIIQIDIPHPRLIRHINSRREGLGEIVARSFQNKGNNISPRRALAFVSYTEHGVEEEIAAKLAFGAKAGDILAALKLVPAARKATV